MLVVQDQEIQHICAVLAGLFAILASALSFQEMYRHLINYSMSRVQKHICRILLMVPIYAIDAAVSIRFMQEAIFLNTVRELYEAFTVWSFMSLIMEFLHNEAKKSHDRGELQPLADGQPPPQPLPGEWGEEEPGADGDDGGGGGSYGAAAL
eukprot:SAG22_NODE_67_length_22882_cov_25.671553_15_plen_152_part_00